MLSGRQVLIFKEEKHQYFWNDRELVSVTQALEESSITDVSMCDPIYLKRGTDVHRATALDDEGKLDWAKVGYTEPWVRCWRRFRERTGFEPKPGGIELALGDPDVGVAGTLDRLGFFEHELGILDIKSAEHATRPVRACGPQLAGYEHLARANGMIEPGVPVRRWALSLGTDWEKDDYRLRPFDDPDDMNVFLSAVNVANWKRKGRKNGAAGWS